MLVFASMRIDAKYLKCTVIKMASMKDEVLLFLMTYQTRNIISIIKHGFKKQNKKQVTM